MGYGVCERREKQWELREEVFKNTMRELFYKDLQWVRYK
jgi:hypothetical protein